MIGSREWLVRMAVLANSIRASWTLWFGVVLVVWGPEIQGLAQPFFAEWFGDAQATKIMRAIGIVVILLRAKTAYQASRP